MRKLTREEVIKRFKEVHGDRYDYSLVNYDGMDKKVKIVCAEHGPFEQAPSWHIRGSNCFKCCGSERYTNETFAEKAKTVHGNKYDYSKVEFKAIKHKVTITCSQHGDFTQNANSHLSGCGCPKCGKDDVAKAHSMGKDKFVQRANKKHGCKYDYSKVDYTNNSIGVIITCKEHGDFEQLPSHHLKGSGCPQCSATERGLRHRLTQEEFVSKAKKTHGDRYDYSKAIYITAKDPVEIVCKEHGSFFQSPGKHVFESGCPHCAKTGFKRDKDAWFYIIHAGSFCGFGVTNNLKQRLKTHHKNLKRNGIEYKVFGTTFGKGSLVNDLEKEVKKKFKANLINTGIEGFRWEALNSEVFIDLLNFVEGYMKENRPSGRFGGT